MTKLKQSGYDNTNPPYLDHKWRYDSHTDIMARFKALGYKPPTEKKDKTK